MDSERMGKVNGLEVEKVGKQFLEWVTGITDLLFFSKARDYIINTYYV